MRSRKLLALLFCLITFPAIAGYMTLLGAGVGSIAPVVSWVSTTDAFPSSSLTFSRTSNATMFDSTGKLTYAPNNLLRYSNTFSNAAWTLVSATVSGSTLTPVAANSSHRIFQSTSAASGSNYIATFVLKPNGYSKVAIVENDLTGNYVSFDMSGAGSVLASSGAIGSITQNADGSYTISHASASGGATFRADLYILSPSYTTGQPTGSWTADGVSGIVLWSQASLSLVTYETTPRTADQVITTSSAYYGPRIDYDPNTLAVKGLLIEEARTNLLVNSKSDGTNLATQNVTVTAQPYTLTFYGTGSVTLSGASTSGPLSGSGAFPTRSTLTFTPSAGTLTLTVAGTVQYAQLEAGSFATSYIPTGASAVTRAADVVQFTGAALTALQGSAGSVIVQSISEASSSPTAITNVIKGTNSILYRDTTGKTGTTNGTTALLTAAAPTWSSAIRNGLAWSASGRSLGYTSSAIATDANTVSNGGTLYLGSSAGSAVESGWYQSLGIWNQRLPDATLSTKLTVGGPYAANDNANPFAPKFAANDNLPVHWRIAL